MIDPALLRPGRLEVHIEIGLPDEKGRVQIFNIHLKQVRTRSRTHAWRRRTRVATRSPPRSSATAERAEIQAHRSSIFFFPLLCLIASFSPLVQMRENKMLHEEVTSEYLASQTKNFSGAEIEGLVKSASSFALYASIDIKKTGAKPVDTSGKNIIVRLAHFQRALDEVHAAFGVDEEDLKMYLRSELINYGPEFERIMKTCQTLINQVRSSKATPLLSVLLEGPNGSGQTRTLKYRTRARAHRSGRFDPPALASRSLHLCLTIAVVLPFCRQDFDRRQAGHRQRLPRQFCKKRN
jgi:hypothetical protein